MCIFVGKRLTKANYCARRILIRTMSKRYFLHLFCTSLLTLMVALIVSSCSDDDEKDWSSSCQARIVDGQELANTNRYYAILVEQKGFPTDGPILLSTDCEWLQLASDTLPRDGRFDVYADRNYTLEGRKATITLTASQHASAMVSLTLVQRGATSEGNADDDLERSYGVGFGYSMFDEYMNPRSIKGRVINEAALSAYEDDDTYSILQENKRGKEELESMAAYSFMELQSKLVENSSVKTGIPGFKKTVKRHTELREHQKKECYYGYARMYKIVASRNMDQAALLDVFRHASASKRMELFTPEFATLYNAILNSRNDQERESSVRAMVDAFGTHLVIRASLGGSIDYAFTLDSKYASTLETSSRTESSQVFGKTKKNSSSSTSSSVLSDRRSNMSFTVTGGSQESITALYNEISGLDEDMSFSDEALANWLGSINVDCLTNDEGQNLKIIDFSFIPIWEFFDGEMRNVVTGVITKMAYEERNSFNLADIGLDNYVIPITREMSDFDGAGQDASLVRVLTVDGEPTVEICNEYVPAIRTDRRVTVYYPIKNGVTSMAQGLFPGDGANPPAKLAFSGSEVYVNPITGYGCGDVLDTLYYLHGTMQHVALNVGVSAPRNVKVTDHRLKFEKSSVTYPVVKLGTGYWIRKNIRETMDWQSNTGASVEKMDANGMLFANSYSCNSSFFFSRNKLLYSHQVNDIGERERWFMPRTSDCESLTAYIGRNHKSLFKNQQSGLDLEFAGCYGAYYILDPGAPANKGKYGLATSIFMYQDKYCFLSFKDVTPLTYTEGNSLTNAQHISLITGAKYLVMDTNYEWQMVEYFDKVKDMKFPVRLFRTNGYNYKTSGI